MAVRDELRERLGAKIISWNEVSRRRIYFGVKKEDILQAATLLFKDLGMRFSIASGVDTPQGLEILYHFSHDASGQIYTVRVLIENKDHPEIDSLAPLFPGAEWIEREMWEMLGIVFKGHPNLKRLLLAEDWPEGNYPLRQAHES